MTNRIRGAVMLVATAIVVALAGCEGARVGLSNELDAPEIRAMDPAVGFVGERVAARVTGTGFLPRVFQDPSALDGVGVDDTFALFVGEVALEEVRFVDPETLDGVVPAGLDPGTYDLRVVTPNGLEAILEDAYRASADAPPRLDAVDPRDIIAGVDAEVLLVGAGLSTGATVTLSDDTPLTVVGADAAGLRVLVDASVADGAYGVIVTNPDGQTARLDDALMVRPPGELEVTLSGAAEINVGQELTLNVTVANTGGSDVEEIALTTRNLDDALLTVVTLPAEIARLGPGQEGTLTLVARGLAAGIGGLGVTAAGVNEISLRAVRSGEGVHEVTIDAPAQLVGELSVAGVATVGQSREVTFTVRNNGGAGAVGVSPGLPALSPAGLLDLTSPPTPASADIPGGGSATFTFTVAGAAAGDANISASASGTDENSGAPVNSIDATASVQVADPVQLNGALLANPAQVSLGASATLAFVVTNNDALEAVDVQPSLVLTSGSADLIGPVPANLDLLPGAQGIFSYTLTPNAAGLINLAASASATSPLGFTLLSQEAVAAVPAQVPPTLSGAWTLPAQVSAGQSFNASVTVSNDGGAAATDVTVSAPIFSGATGTSCVGPTPASAAVAGGASATFTFDCSAGAAGTESLTTTASGRDANHGTSVTAAPTQSGALPIQAPPALTLTWTAPSTITTGQEFTLTATVANTGAVSASGVSVDSLVIGGATGTTCVGPSPATAAVNAGSAQDFTFTCTGGGGGGNETVSAVATGVDANSGEAISSARTVTPAFAVQLPPTLSLAWTTPGQVSFGQTFSAALRVTNTGGADARAVAPGNFNVNSANGTVCSGPDIASADVDGGASAVFTWSCTAGNSLGTDTVSADATALDANTDLPVNAAARTSPAIELVGAAGLVVSWTVPDNVAPGASFTATLTAQNTGATGLNAVAADAVVFDGVTGSSCGAAVPASVSLASGASVAFVYDCTAGVEGAETMTAGASGEDALSGDPVFAPPLSSPVVTVVEPGAISAAVTGPAQVSTGQVFAVDVVVTNVGAVNVDATTTVGFVVNGPSGTSCAGPAPANVDLVPAQVATLRFSCTAGAAGTVSFSSSAQGIDGNTGQLVTAPADTSADTSIQRAAALVATWSSVPGVVSTGQPFTASLEVQNTGEALAEAAAPTGLSISGATGTSCGAPSPATADIGGGQTATFTYSCSAGASAGSFSLVDRAAATDVNSREIVNSATATSATVSVEAAASLSGAWTVPAQIIVGASAAATLRVTNAGQAVAESVAPTGFTVNGAGVSCGAPAPGTQDVPGGATRDFVYTCTATTPGDFTLTAGASGVDENSGQAVAAAAATSASVEVIEFSAVIINEVVTDPLFDWSDSTGGDGISFNRVPGRATADAGDEWIELFNTETEAVDLTGWTILIDDASPATVTLGTTPVVLRFSSGGSLSNFQGGEFLVIGLAGVTSMDDDVTLTLRDDFNTAQDIVSLGASVGGDGDAGNNAPSGASTVSTDAVARVPNGADTDDDSADLAQARSTIGTNNDCATTSVPDLVSRTQSIFDNIKDDTPGTFSHTVTAGADRYLVLAIMTRKQQPVASVSYAGIPMTSLGFADELNEVRNELFALAHPPTGTGTVSISVTVNDTDAIVNALNLVGVRQHFTVEDVALDVGKGVTHSLDVVVANDGSFIVDHFAWKDNVATPASGQTERWNTDDFKSSAGATLTNAAAGVVSLVWNLGADKEFAHGAVVLAPQCQ